VLVRNKVVSFLLVEHRGYLVLRWGWCGYLSPVLLNKNIVWPGWRTKLALRLH
jgi:hypothetical protein